LFMYMMVYHASSARITAWFHLCLSDT
jgi:hypothetical protein